MAKKSFNSPDETMTPPKTKVEIVKLGGSTISRYTFEPGWKWSQDISPVAGTPKCQMHHTWLGISGQLKLALTDGTEVDVTAGDVVDIPPDHDAWVVGNEPAVGIDIGPPASQA